MQSKLKEFENKFDHYLSNDHRLIVDSSFHIFNFIFESYTPKISVEERMKMCLHFHSYEKALSMARSGNLQQAKFWIDYVQQPASQFSDSAYEALNSLYYAMIAYYKFANKEYTEAISDLKIAIKLASDAIENAGLNVMLTSCFEQSLNICRVYFTMHDYENAFKYSGSLLHYMITGRHVNDILSIGNHDLEKLDRDKHSLMLRYISNSIVSKLISVANGDFEQEKKCFFETFKFLWTNNSWNRCPINGYREYFNGLNYFFNEDYDRFLDEAINLVEFLPNMPSMLQYSFLSKIIIINQKQENAKTFEQLNSKLITYFEKELNIQSLYYSNLLVA